MYKRQGVCVCVCVCTCVCVSVCSVYVRQRGTDGQKDRQVGRHKQNLREEQAETKMLIWV